MNIINYLEPLSPNQKVLCKSLLELPQKKILTSHPGATNTQKKLFEYHQIDWQWIALELAFLLGKRIGYRLPDPLNAETIDKSFKQKIDAVCKLYLAELDLITEGWEIISSASWDERGYFPFNQPYELFMNACQFRSEREAEEIFTSDTYNEQTITQVRKILNEDANFYRNKLTPNKKEIALDCHKNAADWGLFSIYAIWDYKNTEFKNPWQVFLKAHKHFKKMFCNENFFKDKSVRITPYIYSRQGDIFILHDRNVWKARIVEENLEFYLP